MQPEPPGGVCENPCMEDFTLYEGDCMDFLRSLPDGCASLVLTDPPYNIGKDKEWDVIENYTEWMTGWMKEAERVLKENGVFYFWHNDIAQAAEVLCAMKRETSFEFRGMQVWDKGKSYRYTSWQNARGTSTLRSWFPVCEYCFHFFKVPQENERRWKKTGLDMIYSNPGCFRELKEWYRKETERLGLTAKDIRRKYTEATGKKPYMLRHYFCDSQFEIPTEAVWRSVYRPLGFRFPGGEYDSLRNEYEEMRRKYEEMRPYHNPDRDHCNIWRENTPRPAKGRHPCRKPVGILSRIIRVSSRTGDLVVDPFMGSGSTGEACAETGRRFAGSEAAHMYFLAAEENIRNARESTGQASLFPA